MSIQLSNLSKVQVVFDKLSSYLNIIPRPIKYLAILIFLLQSPSWPFIWHFGIVKTPLKLKFNQLIKGKLNYINQWKLNLEKVGGLPGYRVRYEKLAWFDDCDYRLHLSNSSYPKKADPVELEYGMSMFAPVLDTGAFLALGARHYNYFREIPVGAKYTIETKCGGWDEKWLYLVTEFIIYPKKKHSKHHKSNGNPQPTTSGISTPQSDEMPKSKLEEIKKTWIQRRSQREDGGIVCCLGVSELCIKIGRITIPPRIALWITMQHPSVEQQNRAKAILMFKDGGSSFLKGGWRNEPNSTTLGNDIHFNENDQDNWVKNGKEHLELIGRGMSGF